MGKYYLKTTGQGMDNYELGVHEYYIVGSDWKIEFPKEEGTFYYRVEVSFWKRNGKDKVVYEGENCASPTLSGEGVTGLYAVGRPYVYPTSWSPGEGKTFYSEIAREASKRVHIPYGLGAVRVGTEIIYKGSEKNENGRFTLDCSGLCWYCGYTAGMECNDVDVDRLWECYGKPGLTFNDKENGDMIIVDVKHETDHVGIYVNEPQIGKADMMYHATGSEKVQFTDVFPTGKRVMYETWDFREKWWEECFHGIGRK